MTLKLRENLGILGWFFITLVFILLLVIHSVYKGLR